MTSLLNVYRRTMGRRGVEFYVCRLADVSFFAILLQASATPSMMNQKWSCGVIIVKLRQLSMIR